MIVGREITADSGQLWLATQQRILDLLTGQTLDGMTRPVPALPGYVVRDLIIRLSSTGADALSGDVHPTRTPPHSPQARAAETDAELLTAWKAQAGALASLVRVQPRASQLLIDLVTHEHDLRGALDSHGARDDDAVVLAVELLAHDFSDRLRAAGAPALRMTCEQWGHDTAAPPYHAIIVADRFELFRAFTGRRSAEEIRRWMWSDDPAPYLPYLSATGALRGTDLDEPDPDVPPEYAERLRSQSWREPVA